MNCFKDSQLLKNEQNSELPSGLGGFGGERQAGMSGGRIRASPECSSTLQRGKKGELEVCGAGEPREEAEAQIFTVSYLLH